MLVKAYKFGVIYAKEGQTHEDEMFGNGTVLLSPSTYPPSTFFLFLPLQKHGAPTSMNFSPFLEKRWS
jgi:hypothetical protein